MDRRQEAEELLGADSGAMFADGWDAAIIGVGQIWGMAPVVVYDTDAIEQALIADGWDADDAREYVAFNITSAYVGPGTPMFARKISGA